MAVKRTSKYQLSQWEKTDQVLMEDFNTDNLNIENALAGLEASKAKQTDLTNLTSTVNTKANQTDLTNLTNTVNTKANQADLASLKTEVAAKASQTALNNLSAELTAARATITRIVINSYTGDGKASRTISLGFTPTAVLLVSQAGKMNTPDGATLNSYGGLALAGSRVTSAPGNAGSLEITSGGFIVRYYLGAGADNSYTNQDGLTFHYIAFG